MKNRLLAVLAATALLAGCSASTEPATTSAESTAASPTPTVVAGEKVIAIGDPGQRSCVGTTEQLVGVTFLEVCGESLTLIEFEPAGKDQTVSAVRAWADKNGAYSPWIVGDDWMVQVEEDYADLMNLQQKGSVVLRSPKAPPTPEEQLKKMMEATAKVTNTRCAAKKPEEMEYGSIVGAGCKEANGDYYTLLYVYDDEDGLTEIKDEQGDFFTMTNHDAYSVEGEYWYVHDIKQSEAKKIAKILDGEVINLNAN